MKQHRVPIWNSFLELAWREANFLSDSIQGKKSDRKLKLKGGTLPDNDYHTLALLVLCNLAIEARANHLIYEAKEKALIAGDVAKAVRWLRTEDKWFILPALARKKRRISSSQMPHQAISQICSYRNDLIHVNYKKLGRKPLPTPKSLISLYNNFVRAMENMNIVLKEKRKERKSVFKKLIV
jgi:hypothetical protein